MRSKLKIIIPIIVAVIAIIIAALTINFTSDNNVNIGSLVEKAQNYLRQHRIISCKRKAFTMSKKEPQSSP